MQQFTLVIRQLKRTRTVPFVKPGKYLLSCGHFRSPIFVTLCVFLQTRQSFFKRGHVS